MLSNGAGIVSVVVPAYQAEATLGRTLDSLRRQTHAGWEALVVDDGSADATAEIALRCSAADPRVRLLRQQHAGVGAARNRGIAEAAGAWLHFLDADDLAEPELHERLLELLSGDPTLELLVAGSRTLAPDGTVLVVEEGVIPGDLARRVARTCPFNPCACLIRADKVRAIGGFDPSFRVAGDWDFWWRLASGGIRAAAVRDVLASYCRREQSLSTDFAAVLRGGLRIILGASGSSDEELAAAVERGAPGAAEAAAIQAFWCAGGLLARRQDAVAVLRSLPRLRHVELPALELANALRGGALDSANRTDAAWSALRLEIGPALDPALTALAAFCGRAGLEAEVRRAIDEGDVE